MTVEQTLVAEPFAADRLDRKKAADFLTNYLLGRHRVAGSVVVQLFFCKNDQAIPW